jgi:hypothetical protein
VYEGRQTAPPRRTRGRKPGSVKPVVGNIAALPQEAERMRGNGRVAPVGGIEERPIASSTRAASADLLMRFIHTGRRPAVQYRARVVVQNGVLAISLKKSRLRAKALTAASWK